MMPDASVEPPLETAEAMTFRKLHENIIAGCNCEKDFRPTEDINSTFTRCVSKREVDLSDFRSYYEVYAA